MFFGIFLSFLMMFPMVATKPYHNKNYQIKNLLTLSMTLTVSLLLTFQYFIDYEAVRFISEKFVFFTDPIFYLALFLNFFGQYLGRQVNKDNEKNLIFSQFGQFLLIALVPIFSYFSYMIFNFENTIEIKYNNIYEMFIFSGLLILLCIFYFYEKIYNKTLIRPDRLILFVLTSTFAFVLINKLMQVYNTEAVYFCTMFFNSIIWIAMAHKNEEIKHVENRHYLAFFIYSLIYILYSYINIIIVNYLPAEHIAIFRTLAAVLSTAFFDYLYNKKTNLTIKDFSILILLFLILFAFKY